MKRPRLEGKQHIESHESPATRLPSSSQPADLWDAPARVRLNMKRSPLESHSERPKQRCVLEYPDGAEVMIGETQVNKDDEHTWSEVSATDCDDGQPRYYSGNCKSFNHKRFHEHGRSTKVRSCQQHVGL